tara:strand:+ start:3087 stop:4451 length:1365 start_codon:yes stop_codon:yes gene_type:complete
MHKTLFDKVWDSHVVKHISDDMDVLYIDQHYIHEVTSPQAFNGIRARGISVFRPDKTLATADHNVPTVNQDQPIKDPQSLNQVNSLKANCQEFGIEHYGIGHKNQGIVHVIGPELGKTKPGMTIVCGDSHTSTHGAFGAIAFGIGTSQVEQVFAAQCLVLTKPKTMKIVIENDIAKGVTSKDITLFIISKLGMQGATGYFVEYTGAAIRKLSMEERMTITNMSIEMGARGGMIGIDDTTIDYVSERVELDEATIQAWRNLNSDEDAKFDKVIVLDAKEIRPMVTVGTSPDTGVNINQYVKDSIHNTAQGLAYTGFKSDDLMSDKVIDYVFIGSCTNGRIEDMRAVAQIANGRKKAANVTVWVVPGSQKVRTQAIAEGLDKIILAAGFEFREPGCSACLAMNDDKIPSGAVCVSTSNRNFEGRQGEGAITILASPITAAASAICGKITDPTPYLN